MARDPQYSLLGEQSWRDPAFYAFALVGVMLLCISLLCSAKARTAQPEVTIQIGQPAPTESLKVNPITPSDYRHAPEKPAPLAF